MSEPHISAASVQTGAILLRQASQTLTGGADGLHNTNSRAGHEEPDEMTPIRSERARRPATLVRQQSARVMQQGLTQNEVQERLRVEATDAFTRNLKWIILSVIVCVLLIITGLVIFISAFLALAHHWDKPCDQPGLKYYLLVNLVWSQVPGNIQKCFIGDSYSVQFRLGVAVATMIPSWFIIGWGFHMVHSAETCPETNPGLFYPTRRYVYFHVVMSVLGLLISLTFAFGAWRLYLHVMGLLEGVGCEAAVRKLPKVPSDAKELIGDDGEAVGCPICMDSFKGEAVRTPCSHYFHEECLATWCKNHLDCPLCRQPVGDPDEPDEAGQAKPAEV